jgi:tetratricopeptide (TPR) repeat protein
VTAVFSWSYRQLKPDAARVFRLAGLHPGPDGDAYAAAAMTGASLEQIRRTMDLLLRAHLIHPARPGRYRLHDLLYAYAASLATAVEDPADDSRRVLARLFDYYLATAAAAMDRLHPAEMHRRPRVPPLMTPAPCFPDSAAARAWLDAERPALIAAALHAASHGWPGYAVDLAATLYRYLADGYHSDALAVHSHACQAARQAGDQDGEARARHGLGIVHAHLGRYEQAATHFEQALSLSRQAGNLDGQARALNNLGTARWTAWATLTSG